MCTNTSTGGGGVQCVEEQERTAVVRYAGLVVAEVREAVV